MLRSTSKRISRISAPRCRNIRSSGLRAYHASVLPNLVSPAAPDFQERAEAMNGLIANLETTLASNRQGGGEKALDRMRSKGKLTPRERYVLRLYWQK
jgi:3-methylcrotonyl-CoA carboxylase beta subunit